jgi:hypothetical protein
MSINNLRNKILQRVNAIPGIKSSDPTLESELKVLRENLVDAFSAPIQDAINELNNKILDTNQECKKFKVINDAPLALPETDITFTFTLCDTGEVSPEQTLFAGNSMDVCSTALPKITSNNTNYSIEELGTCP